MIISIVGSGNTATVLGKLLRQKNHAINEISGRNERTVNALAESLDAKPCIDLKTMNTESDIYLIAVNDDSVAEVSTALKMNNKIIAHTCGSVSINALENTSENFGVFYPLQSLRKELGHIPSIPFLIDGNNAFAKQTLSELAKSVSQTVVSADDETRLNYHLSAIIVSNFSNHLFALAKAYCDAHQTDFNLLLPLINEIVDRLHYYDPAAMQTGPAARGDEATIQKHLQLLDDSPQLKNIYAIMSESIRQAKE
jgi:predicted short-subunit dehydrogenase-like oxidoreductase (DUF2520 family)